MMYKVGPGPPKPDRSVLVGKGLLSGAQGRFRCIALRVPASSLAFRRPYRVQLEAQPPQALLILTAASLVCPAHVPILPLASTRCSDQSFEACAPCSAVAGWVGGAKKEARVSTRVLTCWSAGTT